MSAMTAELQSWPKAAETTLARKRMTMRGLPAQARSWRSGSKRRGRASSFGPQRLSPAPASADVRPCGCP